MTTTTNTPVTHAVLSWALLAEIWPLTIGEQQMTLEDFAAVKAMFDAAKSGRLDEAAFLAGQNDLTLRIWEQAITAIETGKVKKQELN